MSIELPVTGDWADAQRIERVQKGTEDGALVVHVVTYNGGQMTVPIDENTIEAQLKMRTSIIRMVEHARRHHRP